MKSAAVARVSSLFRRPDSLLISSNILGLFLGLLSAALQARALGPAGRGEIAIAIVPGTLIAMLMCFGLPDYFGRRAAQGASVRRLTATAAGFATVIGMLCAAPYMWFISVQTVQNAPSRLILVVYAVVSPVLVYGYCATSVTGGLDRWGAVALSRFVPQLVTVVGMLILLQTGPSVLVVGILLVCTAVLGGLLPGVVAHVWPGGRIALAEFRPALSFGLRGWPAGALALLNQRVDLLLLTALANPSELGLYAVSTTLAAVLNAVATSIAFPVRNRVVRGEHSIVPGVAATTAALVFVVSAVIALVLPVLIPLVLGPQFVAAQGAMVILLVAQVPLASIVVITQGLIGVGRPGVPLVGEVFALVTTVVFVFLWFPAFGIEGAAFANLAGNAISLFVLIFLAHRYIARVAPWRYLIVSRWALKTVKGAGS